MRQHRLLDTPRSGVRMPLPPPGRGHRGSRLVTLPRYAASLHSGPPFADSGLPTRISPASSFCNVRKDQDALEVQFAEWLAGTAVAKRIHPGLNGVAECLDLFAEIGGIFCLNRAFELQVKAQACSQFNNPALKRVPGVRFGSVSQPRLFVDLSKKWFQLAERKQNKSAMGIRRSKKVQHVRIADFEQLRRVRPFR